MPTAEGGRRQRLKRGGREEGPCSAKGGTRRPGAFVRFKRAGTSRSTSADSPDLRCVHAEDGGGAGLVAAAGAEDEVAVLFLLAGEVVGELGPVLQLVKAEGSCLEVMTRASEVAASLETTWWSSVRLPGQW